MEKKILPVIGSFIGKKGKVMITAIRPGKALKQPARFMTLITIPLIVL